MKTVAQTELLLTVSAYVIESPTMPGLSESLRMTANRAANRMMQLPMNSSLKASHLHDTESTLAGSIHGFSMKCITDL